MTGGRWRLPWVVLGVVVVGVPTVFTVMAPETAQWSTGSRSAVIVLWVPVVALAAWFARQREERGDEIVAQTRQPALTSSTDLPEGNADLDQPSAIEPEEDTSS